ncbi:MAG TPA: fumarylacetoacetate hydrolase family protein [Ramlibacter sp.]|nr:fumarylacetoacetate hydrolase family protein [Ramlibacter sp.]
MRYLSFMHAGQESYGVSTRSGIADIGAVLRSRFTDLHALIASGRAAELAHNAIEDLRWRRIPEQEAQLLPPIVRPDKIFCIGVNYADHAQETGIATAARPTVFMRFADSQVGHGQPLLAPFESAQFDFEGELAIVIGKAGRRIAAENAWDHVFGCACYNDGSARDWQFHSSQWGPGKNFWRTGGFGPWLVSRDEVDPATQALTLTTRVNGEVLQRDSTDHMVHDIPALVAYCSTVLPLAPGDVIVTGTPAGVGLSRQPPLFLREGDVVEVEITGLGCLRNTVERG